MIPIRDHNPSGRLPIITFLLIGINVFVFLRMFGMSQSQLENFVLDFALIPALVNNGQNLHTLITSMFLHGGIMHLLGNMLFLYIFGDNLEDRLGHFRFFVWYILCGLGAMLLQMIADPTSTIPNLGASGAIAGVMGGYLVLFPRERVDILIPLGFFLHRATVPAFTMLFYWFALQLISGIGPLADAAGGGIAYFAHIGGFIAGVITTLPLKSRILAHHRTW